jgi:hypothetical protein
MCSPRGRTIACLSALLGCITVSAAALAEDDARWLVQTSVYTTHFRVDPRHNDNQHLLNLEYQRADRSLIGAAAFDNSFGQASQYVYYGRLWRPFESEPLLHIKLTGGLIHGYKDQFRDKIPFNGSGFAPAVIPAIGLSGKTFSGEVVLFGTAGAMLAIGFHM